MTGRLRRLRTAVDLYGRWSWRYRMTTLAVVLGLYGIASAVAQVPPAVNLTLAVVGVLASIHEVRENRRESLEATFVPRLNDDYADVVAEADDAVGLRSASGVGLYSVADSATIRRRPIAVTIDEHDFVTHESLEKWALAYLTRAQRGRTFFNGSVVGLSAWESGGLDQGIRFRRCGYYDFIATNLLAGCDVESASGTLLLGRRLFVDRFGKLRSFGSSRLANVIGVSTLAFSADGKLLLVHQTDKNVGSPKTRAPSGSGALEARDVTDAHQAQATLQAVIAKGAARELAEECNLREDEIQVTHLLGFGRWLSRGAMPEFSALTFLTGEADLFVNRSRRKEEREYVESVRAIRLTDPDSWAIGDALTALPPEERSKASFPLVLALTALVHALRDPDWEPGRELRRRLASS